jgi:hypothetical protein
MKNRTAVIAALITAALLIVSPAAADARTMRSTHAGPTHAQPASVPIAPKEAQLAARLMMHRVILPMIPAPNYSIQGRCVKGDKGRYIWHCPVFARGTDVKCSANLMIWADILHWYVQADHLRCTNP